MSKDVAQFFDREADEYHGSRRAEMWHFHQITARKLESQVGGDVLSLGGLWRCADLSQVSGQVTIADVSMEMLHKYGEQESDVWLAQCDARTLPFPSQYFDHVVLPLLLHHITGRNGWTARVEARRALTEASRVLKADGSLWISEFVLSPVVYAAELVSSPVTRRLLSLAEIPLVVMHTCAFYAQALKALDFLNVSAEQIQSPDAKATDCIQPIIGLPWLRVPRIVYPVKPVLISARR